MKMTTETNEAGIFDTQHATISTRKVNLSTISNCPKKKKKVCAPVVQILFYLSTVQLLQAGPRDLCTKLSGPRKADLLENTLLYAVVDSLWTPLGACQIL